MSCCTLGPTVVCMPDPRLYCSCRLGVVPTNSNTSAIKSLESSEPKYKRLRRVDSVWDIVEKSKVKEKSILFHVSRDMCGISGYCRNECGADSLGRIGIRSKKFSEI